MPRGLKQSAAPKKEYTPFQNMIWFCCVAAVVSSIVAIGISIFLPNWRVAGPITFNYIHKASKRQHLVDITRYGLHTVIYDNYVTKQTWSKRVSTVKAKGYMAIQNSSQNHRGGYKNFFVNECPAACRDGIAVRIRVYENMLGYNNLLLIVLVVFVVLAGLGVLWYLIFGKSIPVIGGCWVVSGTISAACILYWNRATHKTWLLALASNMMPFPYLSYCYRIALLSNIIIACAGLVLFFSDILNMWFLKRKNKAYLNDFLKNKNNMGMGGVGQMPFGNPTAPVPNMQPQQNGPPVMKQPATPQSGFNPGSLFSGMGMNNNMTLGNNNQNNSPSMWAKNFQF